MGGVSVADTEGDSVHRNQYNKLDHGIEQLEKRTEVDSSTTSARTMNETYDSPAATAVPSAPTLATNTVDFGEWYVSLSFGKSTSKNYTKAVALAEAAPKYIRSTDEMENIIHQAIYGPESEQYLDFIALYELVSNWKSSFVVINGSIVDRKIIQGLNYCYGDKCRSSNPSFCLGASMFTENPFGCHRLQVSSWNHAWWTYGRFDSNGVWHVDKLSIGKRMKEKASMYELCPAFSRERVLEGLESLPTTIDPNSDENWRTCTHNIDGRFFKGVCPAHQQRVLSYVIEIRREERTTEESKQSHRFHSKDDTSPVINNERLSNKTTKTTSIGCLVYSIVALILSFLLVFGRR